MTSKTTLLLLSASALAAGVFTHRLIWPKIKTFAQAPRAAVTVEYTDRNFDEHGREARSEARLLAIRSDGSSVIRRTRLTPPDPAKPSAITTSLEIADLAKRHDVTLFPDLRLKTSTPLDNAAVERFLERPLANCGPAKEDREVPSLLGQRVLLRSVENKAPDGRLITQKDWVAPDLGCIPLRTVATLNDPKAGVTLRNTKEATSIILGEPAENLFLIPTDYAERSPSQVMAAEAESMGRPCATCGSAIAKIADQRYAAAKQR